jgi:hypothetical protein
MRPEEEEARVPITAESRSDLPLLVRAPTSRILYRALHRYD